MKRSWHTRRVEGVKTPFDRQFGITEQSFLCVEHGVGFGNSLPHAGTRAASIFQPRAQCLQALHHSPDPVFATVADDLNNISRFVLRERPSNNDKTFFFPSHYQAINNVGFVLKNVSDGSLYLPSQTNYPHSINDGALDFRLYAVRPQVDLCLLILPDVSSSKLTMAKDTSDHRVSPACTKSCRFARLLISLVSSYRVPYPRATPRCHPSY